MGHIAIRVTARSRRPGLGGWRKGADGCDELEIRVAEPPEDGAANAAAVKLLAKALGVSRAQVTIAAGHSNRHKRVALPFDLDEVRRRLGA